MGKRAMVVIHYVAKAVEVLEYDNGEAHDELGDEYVRTLLILEELGKELRRRDREQRN